jgi:hypothetical protein
MSPEKALQAYWHKESMTTCTSADMTKTGSFTYDSAISFKHSA